MMVCKEQARKQDEVSTTLQRDLEVGRYNVNRVQKQYDSADPENRLVADELERRRDQGLQRVRAIEPHIAQRQ